MFVWVNRPLDAGVTSRYSHCCCFLCGNLQHHGSWDTMGACVARIQDGFFHSLESFLQTGFKTWEEKFEYLARAWLCSTGRHWVDNIITPILLAHQLLLGWVKPCPLQRERERGGIGLYSSSATSVYYHTLFYRWTPQVCKVPLVALH